MKKCLGRAMVGFLLLLSACTIGSGAPITFTQVRVPALSTFGSFDAMDVDPKTDRLFAADRADTGVDVFDLSSTPATYTHTIRLSTTPNGLAWAPDLNRVFVGLADGKVAIIDQTDKVIQEVTTGATGIDLIDYSPSTHEVFAASPDDSKIARIDGSTGAVKNVIELGKVGLEQPRYNPVDKLLYAVSPDTPSALYALDPSTGAVKNKIDMGSCHGHGLAIDPKTDQALVACVSWAQRINLRDTSDQETFNQVGGGDIISHNAIADRFLVAEPDEIPSGVAILGGNPMKFIANVHTRAGGNSAVLDDARGIVYTADTRPGQVGLLAFNLPAGEPPVTIDPTSLTELGAIAGAVVLAMLVIGRGADPKNRPEPIPIRRRRRA